MRITLNISTEYGDSNRLFNVPCLYDDKIWTSGNDRFFRPYNLGRISDENSNQIRYLSGSYPPGSAVI